MSRKTRPFLITTNTFFKYINGIIKYRFYVSIFILYHKHVTEKINPNTFSLLLTFNRISVFISLAIKYTDTRL